MRVALVSPAQNIKNLNGVVALRVLTNNLLAALYTNGLLRIIQISGFTVVLETNLMQDEARLGQVLVSG